MVGEFRVLEGGCCSRKYLSPRPTYGFNLRCSPSGTYEGTLLPSAYAFGYPSRIYPTDRTQCPPWVSPLGISPLDSNRQVKDNYKKSGWNPKEKKSLQETQVTQVRVETNLRTLPAP